MSNIKSAKKYLLGTAVPNESACVDKKGVSDDELLKTSKMFIEKNRKAYEALAK